MPVCQHAPDNFLARRHRWIGASRVIQRGYQVARQANRDGFSINRRATHFFHFSMLDFTTLCGYLMLVVGQGRAGTSHPVLATHILGKENWNDFLYS